MTHQEQNRCAENIIDDLFGYAELHSSVFDHDEVTLNLFQEVAQRLDEHIEDLRKATGKTRRLEAAADAAHEERRAA